MVRYSLFEDDKAMLENFSKYSKIYGIVFLIIGAIGIIYPAVISLATAVFYGWLLFLSSLVMVVHTWQTNKRDWLGWLKAFIFFLVSLMIIFNPLIGVAALGILFAFYFFMDSFASFALALELRPRGMWWIPILNGILSSVLGGILISSWPISSLFMVGILVGVNLFFDGLSLLSLGMAAKTVEKQLSTVEDIA